MADKTLDTVIVGFPPLDDYALIVGCHSLVDPSYAPAGQHVAYTEQLAPPASTRTEKQWLETKKRVQASR